MRWLRVTVASVVSLAALAARAQIPADLEARAVQIVAEERAAGGAPSMSVAIFGEGRVLALFASGDADVESHSPATIESLYQAASVTKLLTAALVMREVERGKLSLDAPVNESLPDERQVRDPAGEPVPVTLRQLLSHSSGLPVSWAGIQGDPNEPPRSLDELLSHGLRTVRRPGEKLIYANDAFALAGWLAARAEGVSFDELARTGLFLPLGMSHSSLVPPRDAGPLLVTGYGGGPPFYSQGRTPHQTVSGTAPAGALITTASDLARFGLAILGGGELDGARILSRESVAEMTRVQARAHPGMRMGFGLGFGVIEEPSRTRVWWDGSLAGAASRLMLVPERGLGVAILSNLGDNGPVNVAADRILELLAPRTSPVFSAGAPGDESAVPGTYRFTDAVDPSARYLEWLANARVTRDERGVWLDSPLGRAPALLVPAGDGSFTIGGRSALTGAPALFDGDRLYLGFLEARRIPFWQSARALAVYAGIAVLALAVAGVRLALRFFRSRRRAGAV